jgi:hypothetical protein
MNGIDVLKKAEEIINYKYSYKHETKLRKGNISVILSDDEARYIGQALRVADRLKSIIEDEDELRNAESEIERLKKNANDYVPPLDDYIDGEQKRADYLKERIKRVREMIFAEPKKEEKV